MKNIVVYVLVAATASACTTLRQVPLGQAGLQETVRAGDSIVVDTRDGRELEFKVENVTNERIIGGGEQVLASDIQRIDRREISWGKTTLLIVGVGIAIAGILNFSLDICYSCSP